MATTANLDKFWSLAAPDLLTALASTMTGLQASEAARRLSARTVEKEHDFSAWALFLGQFKSPLVILLILAAVLSFGLNDRVDAIVIMVIVLLSGCLGFFQEWGAHDAVRKMLAIVQVKTTVLRDGKPLELTTDRVVAGDVIQLTAGATIPGDCYILQSRDLFIDEATLTGETFPAEKHAGIAAATAPIAERNNSLFQGTHVVSGTATALIVKTGAATEFGKVSLTLRKKPPETDFELGIALFGLFLVKLTLIFVGVIFLTNILLHRPLLESFMFSLALAVGLTPQLLPAIISVNLAGGAKRMAAVKVIVKRLSVIESFGSMNVLCSDKTGTITEGVVQLEGAVDINGKPYDKVMLFAYLNSSMETGFVNPIDEALRNVKVSGAEAYKKEDEVPYDFIRKRLSILVSNQGRFLMLTKGALHNILDVCTHFERGDGSSDTLDAVRPLLDKTMADYSARGYRVLGVAYKEMQGAKINASDENGMTLAGLLIFRDPPKPGIDKTIKSLNSLGIALKIITGDNELVAAAVAKQVGFANPKVINCQDLHKLSEAALLAEVSSVDVFAGVEPSQKEQIILALKKAGNVVGYIGDGINDASALHAADVAISVNNAVDVAKEAAQLVMLEHALDVLIEGVRVGRMTFANTLKYIFMA
ncbi:MAG: HAD-IC family P-type ATPase, partial [Cyanobacteria bacterium REEB67]|nr:HAD-IC family P-type ATPase [Cyanobacteria bacterium REEB67]